MVSDLDDLFEQLVPGSGRGHARVDEAPALPTSLDLVQPELLGSGQTGWVYRATDPVLQRAVAAKVARPERGAAAREELLREARRTAAVRHPSVLSIHRVVVADGLLVVQRQLAPDDLLSDRLAAWRRRPDEAWPRWQRIALLGDLADALATAHAAEVVHGDLHPGQVALSDRHPFLLDWAGLPPTVGTLSGTPEYAAPEQLDGQPASASSDVFALCALGWELLHLRPFRPARPHDAVGPWLASLRTLPPPPVDGLPEALAAGLAADPAQRPSAAELRDALEQITTGRADRHRRAALARDHLQRTAQLLSAFEARERRLVEEQRVAAVQRVRVPSWAPADDKQGLWSAEDRVLDLLDAQAGTWTLAIEEAVRATGLDPDGTDAPRFLARLWWERWVMARQRGYLGEEQLAAARVRQHDDGTYAPRLDAVGRLTVSSPGRLLRVVRHRRRFTTEHVADTPCEALPLPAGAYQVVYADSGRPPKTPVVASLAVGPHEDVVSPARPPEGPEGFVAVPAGSFPMGGDPDAVDALEPCRPFVDTVWVAVHPVTAGQWLEWMRTLSPAEARAACPAFDLPYLGRQRLWEWLDDGTLRRPDTWADDHPIAGIAVEQAEAYAAWRSEGSDWRFALPTEEQWEKAARGADQRVFPWGTLFDPCLAHTRRSLQGGPHPGPVGAFPSDRSVYGVADLSGGVRELTRTRAMSGGRVVRGGSWADDAQGARLASRHSLPEGRRDLRVGFRLVATPQRSDRAI